MKELIHNLKVRRGMYIFDDSYKSLAAFITGYQLAVFENSGENVSNEFQDWLREKVGVHFSTHWSNYIHTEIANEKDAEACIALLDLLEDFLEKDI